jgi:hypothetical protein
VVMAAHVGLRCQPIAQPTTCLACSKTRCSSSGLTCAEKCSTSTSGSFRSQRRASTYLQRQSEGSADGLLLPVHGH